MPLYESTFIARQDLSRQDVSKLTEQFTGIIESGKGKVVKNEYWGLRTLAYNVGKNRKGHYTMLSIDAPFEALKEMQRTMGIQEEVVRTLTVRIEKISEEPSVMMASRSDREDRPEEGGEIAEVAVAETTETETKE